MEDAGFYVAYDKLTKMHKDPSMKAVIPATEADLKVLRSAYLVQNILEETITIPSKGICTTQGVILSGDANKKTFNALIGSGIIQYWSSYLLNYEMKALLQPPSEPKVFSMASLRS